MAGTVSVVIPCFNLGRWLPEAVDSVLAQTRNALEICVIDDGSKDAHTLDVLAGFTRDRTTLVRTPNRGLAAARNLGAQRTTGDYLCFLDADDVLGPAYLERTAAVLDAEPDVSFVSTWQRTFGEESWDWRRERCDLPALLADDTVHTAALVRRRAFDEAGGFDGAMPAMGYEDWDLWLSLAERGHRGRIVPETLFFYRRRGASMFHDCTRPATHLALVEYLQRKHAAAYRTHLLDVLALKEAEAAGVLAENHRLEQELAGPLALVQGGLEEELRRLQARAAEEAEEDAKTRHVAALEAHARKLEAELQALRASRSWQVTAPIRAAYDLVSQRRKR